MPRSKPIIVKVENGKWSVPILNEKPTKRDIKLAEVLKHLGGVSKTVSDGLYHFNACKGAIEGSVVFTLMPIE